MDIYFLGFTAVRLRGKKTSIVIDPFDKEKTGIKFEKTEADAVLLTAKNSPQMSIQQIANSRVVIDGPGEYEVGGVSIVGIAASGLTTYYIKMDGIALLHPGALQKKLSENELDRYPNVDIFFAPPEGADMVSKLEPKVVIPINFGDNISRLLKELGKEGTKPATKLSITKDKLPAELEVVVLE